MLGIECVPARLGTLLRGTPTACLSDVYDSARIEEKEHRAITSTRMFLIDILEGFLLKRLHGPVSLSQL